ncbi:MAG: UDP-N-acetylmuramoyl-L-alanine--D-glutamate ligase [Candidatus Babeliaceae bacterium]
MKFLENKKIGIWGLGITGKSLISYLNQFSCTVSVIDQRSLNNEEKAFLKQNNSFLSPYSSLDLFLQENDVIIPSAGIDLRPFSYFSPKFIGEIDLFCKVWQKPIIAITGTLGKTTITSFLSKILEHNNLKIATGGNIGRGLLDLTTQENTDYAVIELSSFQLELTKKLDPFLAILTNLYPNHLDRHETVENYFQAKCNIIKHQNPLHQALVPLELAPLLRTQEWAHNRSFNFFSLQKPLPEQQVALQKNDTLFYYTDQGVITENVNQQQNIYNHQLPTSSYPLNWLIVIAALHILNKQFLNQNLDDAIPLPEHRLELIAMYRTLSFYNDSKSTLMQATLAAVEKLQGKPLILFLGGVSKGVDRTLFMSQLKNKVHTIFCFGAEAHLLAQACALHAIAHFTFPTLDAAFNHAIQYAPETSTLLLSPGGASFDLFKDYEERGNHFKNLVKNHGII